MVPIIDADDDAPLTPPSVSIVGVTMRKLFVRISDFLLTERLSIVHVIPSFSDRSPRKYICRKLEPQQLPN